MTDCYSRLNVTVLMMMMKVTVTVLFSELSRDAEMALTSKWQAIVGDEFDIVVSVKCLVFSIIVDTCIAGPVRVVVGPALNTVM